MASNRRSLCIECERQASAARLRAMRSAHARSVAQLHALIAAGQKQMKAQEEAFQRDLETFKEKADKNGEWMTRIRVSEWSW